MSANALLSTIILVAFIVTVVLAIGSYGAYKMRERRRPGNEPAAAGREPEFFERVWLQPPPAGAHEPEAAPHGDAR
jgi:heme/copper-type cytochrome/quinol oxidase subunit 2